MDELGRPIDPAVEAEGEVGEPGEDVVDAGEGERWRRDNRVVGCAVVVAVGVDGEGRIQAEGAELGIDAGDLRPDVDRQLGVKLRVDCQRARPVEGEAGRAGEVVVCVDDRVAVGVGPDAEVDGGLLPGSRG